MATFSTHTSTPNNQFPYNKIKMRRKNKKKRLSTALTIVKPTTYPVVVQTWADYEGQNIVTPECWWTVHLEERDRNDFVSKFWEYEMKVYRNQMPRGYLREEGLTYTAQAKERIYKKLLELRGRGIYGLWITHLDLLAEPK